MSPDLKPELETVADGAPKAPILIAAGVLLLITAALTLWPSGPDPPQAPADDAHAAAARVEPTSEVKPQSLIHLDGVTPKDSLRQFEAAKGAISRGEFPQAERLLNALLERHPKAAMAHAMRSLTHFFQQKDDLSAQDSTAAALLGRDLPTQQRELLSLTDRSWREHDNKVALLEQWRALRDARDEPVLTLLYLSAARYLIQPSEFEAALAEEKKRHPEVVALWLLELRVLQTRSGPNEVLKAAREAERVHPASGAIQLVRYATMAAMGQYTEAESGLKKVLVQDANLVGARMALADIYVATKREAERVQSMLFVLSDTTAVSDQLRFLEQHASKLANHGRLKDASKLWDFCIRTGLDEGFLVRAASCGMTALTALTWLKVEDQNERWHMRMTEVLDQPELDTSVRKLHRLLLLWNTTLHTIQGDPKRVGDARSLLSRVQAFPDGALPFDLKRWLVARIEFEIALIERDRPRLRASLTHVLTEARATDGTLSCKGLDAQRRAGEALKDEAMVAEAVDLVLKGACVPHVNLGIQRANALAIRTKALTKKGDSAQAKALLGEFWTTWAEADEDLSLFKWAKSLETSP